MPWRGWISSISLCIVILQPRKRRVDSSDFPGDPSIKQRQLLSRMLATFASSACQALFSERAFPKMGEGKGYTLVVV